MREIRSIPTAPSDAPVGRPLVAAALTALLGLGCVACAGPRYAPPPAVDPINVPVSVTSHAIFARADDAIAQLEQLPESTAAPVVLRRAFLALEVGRTRAAIDATSQVLYGPNKPSANEEAFARYLRGLAYVRAGTADLATYDLDRARALALDPDLKRRLAELTTATPTARANAVAALGVKPRRSWGATNANLGRLNRMDRATRVTVHHSAVYFRSFGTSATAAQLQRIQREHMNGRSYGDIGYHFLVDPAGRIWEGREMRWQGAHASGANNVRNIGVCLLGNFMRGSRGHLPTGKQVDALERLLGAIMHDHGISPRHIYRHSDFKATACPGPLLDPVLDRLVADFGRRRNGLATPTP